MDAHPLCPEPALHLRGASLPRLRLPLLQLVLVLRGVARVRPVGHGRLRRHQLFHLPRSGQQQATAAGSGEQQQREG